MPLGGAPVCPTCQGRVYFNDEKTFGSKSWHKKCFKCTLCSKVLESGIANVTTDEQLVCNACVRKNGTNNGGPHAKNVTQAYFNKQDTDCCPRCGKRVYFAEQKIAIGRKWHNVCFSCASCNKKVDSTTVRDHDGELYCSACHGRQFGPKGYGYAGGAGTMLSMDTGKSHEITRENVPHTAEAYVAPVADRVDGSRTAPSKWGGIGGDKCARCAKTVYLAEKKQAAGHSFHTTCFTCGVCNKKLDSSILTEKEGEIFCKSCYGKNFGPKGYGYGTGAGTLQMN